MIRLLLICGLIGLAVVGVAALCGLAYIVWLYGVYIFATVVIALGLYLVITGFLKKMWRTNEYEDDGA